MLEDFFCWSSHLNLCDRSTEGQSKLPLTVRQILHYSQQSCMKWEDFTGVSIKPAEISPHVCLALTRVWFDEALIEVFCRKLWKLA